MVTCSGFEIVESATGAYKTDRYRLTHRGHHAAGTLRSWYPRRETPPTAAELEHAAQEREWSRARAELAREQHRGLLKGLSAKYGHLTEEQLVRLREEVARAPAS